MAGLWMVRTTRWENSWEGPRPEDVSKLRLSVTFLWTRHLKEPAVFLTAPISRSS